MVGSYLLNNVQKGDNEDAIAIHHDDEYFMLQDYDSDDENQSAKGVSNTTEGNRISAMNLALMEKLVSTYKGRT